MRWQTSVVLVVTCLGSLALTQPADHEITSFPGFTGPLPSKQYAGYINVPGTEKMLYYIFVTSLNDPSTDPVVLWLNGGPGCSSVGGGYIEEHGPFTYNPSPQTGSLMYSSVNLSANPFTWATTANMLYIDSPAGVGLSYSTNPDDYTTDDYSTTEDLYNVILQWFNLYQDFLPNEFFLTGESYAGVYVPLTASNILDGIAAGVEPLLNFQGYAIGNPSTDGSTLYNQNGLYAGFHLISQQTDDQLNSDMCEDSLTNFNESVSQSAYSSNTTAGPNVEACDALLYEVYEDTAEIMAYDINKDCFWGQQTANAILFNATKARLASEGVDWQDTIDMYQPLDDYCDYDDRVAHFYLNDPDVRTAIHAETFANATQTLAGFFEMCTARLNYSPVVDSTIPYHEANIARGARVLVYSGDHDTVVPTSGTQLWTSELGAQLGIVQPWSPWYIQQLSSFGYQIGGYLTQYEGLSFITIRSAGHQVPTTKPDLAAFFFQNFLTNTLNATTTPPDSFVLSNLFPADPDESATAIYAK